VLPPPTAPGRYVPVHRRYIKGAANTLAKHKKQNLPFLWKKYVDRSILGILRNEELFIKSVNHLIHVCSVLYFSEVRRRSHI
jgi:hypothetical protein